MAFPRSVVTMPTIWHDKSCHGRKIFLQMHHALELGIHWRISASHSNVHSSSSAMFHGRTNCIQLKLGDQAGEATVRRTGKFTLMKED
ncbi:hypothetical protein Mapa_001007 [Marchantia paleacea]|nr:hypothetical protein Mapa_001007 [Marchantia paleacea]